MEPPEATKIQERLLRYTYKFYFAHGRQPTRLPHPWDFPGMWMWFGAFPGAFGLGRAQPQRRGTSP